MADNPFDPKYVGLLGALRGEPLRNALADYVSSLTPKTEVSPLAQAIAQSDTGTAVSPFNGATHDLFSPLKPAPSPYSFGNLGAVADLFPPAKPALPVSSYTNALSGAVADLFPTTPPSNPFGSLARPPSPPKALYIPPPKPVAPSVKRKAFFSFHFPDSLRVNAVRNTWKISHPSSATMRSFQDSSL